MKKTAILVILVSLLLIAGCTSPSPSSGSSTPGISLPFSTGSLVQGKPLPMDGNITLGSGNKTFKVWIDSFEIDPVKENGDQSITIYVAAKSTGTERVRLVWFSKLTDLNGKTYGGIGISHDGSGARTVWLSQYDPPEAARDYVTIRSDRDLSVLSKGAVLDVYFMEKPLDNVSVSMTPDYHVAWTIDPGTIQ
jgi:hypothetical protein